MSRKKLRANAGIWLPRHFRGIVKRIEIIRGASTGLNCATYDGNAHDCAALDCLIPQEYMTPQLADSQLAEQRRARNRIRKRKSRQRQLVENQRRRFAESTKTIEQITCGGEISPVQMSAALEYSNLPCEDPSSCGNTEGMDLEDRISDGSINSQNTGLVESGHLLALSGGPNSDPLEQAADLETTSIGHGSEQLPFCIQLQDDLIHPWTFGSPNVPQYGAEASASAFANKTNPLPIPRGTFLSRDELHVESLEEKNSLHIYANRGSAGGAKFLTSHSIDIDQVDLQGYTALHLAVLHGHESVVEVLLQNGADIEKREPLGKTVLHLAALYGHEKLLEMIIRHGADPTAVVLETAV